MPQWAREIAKALVGAGLAGIGAATTALLNDSTITAVEWLAVAGASLAALYGVWRTPWMPNQPKEN